MSEKNEEKVVLKQEDLAVLHQIDADLAKKKLELANVVLHALSLVDPIAKGSQALSDKLLGFAKVNGVDLGNGQSWRFNLAEGAFVRDTPRK